MDWNGLKIPDSPYYMDDYVTIYHGDCREILPDLPKVDLVLTDPPYGIETGKIGKIGASKLAQVKDYGIQTWDSRPLDKNEVEMLLGIGSHHIIFGGNYIADILPASRCWLVWDKENWTNKFADCELAWTDFDSPVRLYKWRWAGMLQEPQNTKEYRYHPTQKPVGLLGLILRDYATTSDIILDSFAGSGSTLVAAKKLNHKCIGIEIKEKYCEIAAKRCSQSVMDLRIEVYG